MQKVLVYFQPRLRRPNPSRKLPNSVTLRYG